MQILFIFLKQKLIMEGIDHIYNGLGYITYSLCMADGAVQDDERHEVEELVKEAAKKQNFHVSFADGVFRLSQMEHLPQTTALHLGIDEFEKHAFYLKPELQKNILDFLNEVAIATPPITEVEESVINQVKEFFAGLN